MASTIIKVQAVKVNGGEAGRLAKLKPRMVDMFTAPQLNRIAGIIRKLSVSQPDRERIAVHFADEMREENPKMDRGRFISAASGRPLNNQDVG